MANIKPLAQSSDKWQRRSAAAGNDYTLGVQNPRRQWAEAAAAAEDAYKQGVTTAAQSGRFGAGIRAAGNERWQRGATEKGPARFAEGVTLSADRWQQRFAPFQAAIERTTLPSRGPAGSPQNLQRVAAIANALRQVKVQTKR